MQCTLANEHRLTFSVWEEVMSLKLVSLGAVKLYHSHTSYYVGKYLGWVSSTEFQREKKKESLFQKLIVNHFYK